MEYLLYTIHVLTSIFLILVVLLQQGKGADLSVFGGGATMTAFGARGAASLLHKLTVGGFVVFIVTTLAIGVFTKSDDSVLSSAAAAAATDEAAAVTDEGGDTGGNEAAGILPEAEEPTVSAEDEGESDADAEAPAEDDDAAAEETPPAESGN